MIEALLQTGGGVTEILIYRIVYLVAMASLGSMIFLAFRIQSDYHDGVYVLLGTLSILCFTFSWGGENFMWPVPGLVWLIGIIILAFMLGLFVGWLLPYDSDVLVRKPLKPER